MQAVQDFERLRVALFGSLDGFRFRESVSFRSSRVRQGAFPAAITKMRRKPLTLYCLRFLAPTNPAFPARPSQRADNFGDRLVFQLGYSAPYKVRIRPGRRTIPRNVRPYVDAVAVVMVSNP